MEINDILNQLGLDLSNPDVKRGAMEAIEAILTSRAPINGGELGGGGGGETEVELDPDLLQPSIKQAPPADISDDDVEIEDEENILDQIKHNDSEDPIENTNSTGNDSDSDSESSNSSEDESSSDTNSQPGEQPEADENDTVDSDTETENSAEEDETETSSSERQEDTEDAEELDNDDTSDTGEFDYDEDEESDEESDEKSDEANESEEESDAINDTDEPEDEEDKSGTDEENESEDEFDYDEDDLIDDVLKDSTEDDEIKTKHNDRKIKRERTLAAAKKTLADAQAKKAAPALIRELEKAIEALEALTEAVGKSLKDISDNEFNQMVNRVFDAIDAIGGSGLTFTSEKEREAQVKEIKDDMAKNETQVELSAEDAAKIRAETQAVKAREKEAAKYAPKGHGSFKGFQEFLNSLYRAVALQVSVETTKDDSWSALSRRNSGAGVLRQGKKINELPNRKIPVIDFYFDCSASWDDADIDVGMKAVQSLADMEAKGQIKINIYYFSNNVFSDITSARNQGGTAAWNEIVKNIITTQATNVIVMTDWDMENTWRPAWQPPLKYTVPGYVWYLWKDGENAPRLPRDLKGRGGVQQFAFSASDV